MDEMRVNIEDRHLVCGGTNEMRPPYFFIHRLCVHIFLFPLFYLSL